MQNNKAKNGRGKAVQDAIRHARQWLENYGIRTVPLIPRTKKPRGEDGTAKATDWNKLRITRDTIEDYFRPNDNIGGLWGEPSNWIIDIDLDCPEALIASQYYLPKTYTYGRAGAPASHFLYRCEGAITRKYQSRQMGTIVEIRSSGTQSVLPPSIHPSGERYKAFNKIDIAEIRWGNLDARIKKLAGVGLAAKYYPEKGGRHDFVHAMTGALLWAKWSDDDVRRFMQAVIACQYDGETKDRDGSVENTILHYHKGDNVQGWPSLSAFMPGQDLMLLQRWVGSSRMPDNSEVAPDSIAAEPPPRMKDRLFDVPGLVGRIAKWSGKQSYAMQPLFDVGVGLMSVALASQNKYLVAGYNTPLQPYMMLLAPTAGGKESAMEAVMQIAARVGLKNHIVSGMQSYHAMLDVLSKPPHVLCWHWDEAARKLRTAVRSQGGQDYQILTYLLSLYGKGNKTVPGMPGRKASIEAIEHPFFVVMAAAQPNQLLEAISASDMSMGLVNRFLLLDAGSEMARTNDMRSNIFPSAISESLKELNDAKARPIDPGMPDADGFIRVHFESQEAFEIFSDFEIAAREWGHKEEGSGEMWGRANQNALICAGIVAVGCNPRKPVITVEIAQWGVEFVTWSVERWIQRIEQSSSRSVTESASKNVERLIRGVRNFKHLAKHGREQELVADGKMPRSMLTRMCRHLRSRDLDDVLSQLCLADLVGASDEDGIDCYWAKQVVRQKKSA